MPAKATKPDRVTKVRDRVLVKAGCVHQMFEGKTGTIAMTQEFDGHTCYWVIVDGMGDVGWWFPMECIVTRQGIKRALQKAKQVRCHVVKDDFAADFDVDEYGVTSLEDEGYTVTAV